MKDLATIRAEKCAAEKEAISAALLEAGGNISKAARLMGLSRYQLIRRIHKYGLWGET